MAKIETTELSIENDSNKKKKIQFICHDQQNQDAKIVIETVQDSSSIEFSYCFINNKLSEGVWGRRLFYIRKGHLSTVIRLDKN